MSAWPEPYLQCLMKPRLLAMVLVLGPLELCSAWFKPKTLRQKTFPDLLRQLKEAVSKGYKVGRTAKCAFVHFKPGGSGCLLTIRT